MNLFWCVVQLFLEDRLHADETALIDLPRASVLVSELESGEAGYHSLIVSLHSLRSSTLSVLGYMCLG